MQIFFISCPEYLNLLRVNNPIIASFPRYLDPRSYADIIDFLRLYYYYAAKVPKQQKLSISTLRIKSLSRIRDISEFIDIEAILVRYMIISKIGRLASINSQLFKYNLLLVARELLRYPQIIEYKETRFSLSISGLTKP